jgi:hypothetical protein
VGAWGYTSQVRGVRGEINTIIWAGDVRQEAARKNLVRRNCNTYLLDFRGPWLRVGVGDQGDNTRTNNTTDAKVLTGEVELEQPRSAQVSRQPRLSRHSSGLLRCNLVCVKPRINVDVIVVDGDSKHIRDVPSDCLVSFDFLWRRGVGWGRCTQRALPTLDSPEADGG